MPLTGVNPTALLDAISDAVLLVDSAGIIHFANSQSEMLFGYSREEFCGSSIDLLMPARVRTLDRDHLLSYFAASPTRPPTTGFALRACRRDGSEFPVDISLCMLRTSDSPLVIASIRDRSEREKIAVNLKLSEEKYRLEKLEAVGRLAGGIAHDFNNYLTIILGNCQLMKAGLPPDHQFSKNLEQTVQAGKRSAELTGQLLAFARKHSITPKRLDINECLRSAESTLRRTAGENILFTLSLGEALRPGHFDPTQLDQVLMNLTINARDAMPHGGSLIIGTANASVTAEECRGIPLAEPGEYVVLTVKDDGTGMDEPTRNNAFEPFFTTKLKGTGLGLATVYGIVSQHGGFIDLQSAPDKGTSIKIYIPRID
jgi:PAS domain S-box-containing protein